MKSSKQISSPFWITFPALSTTSLAQLVVLGAALTSAVLPVVAQDNTAPQTATAAPQAAPVKPMTDEQKRIDFLEKQLAPKIAKDFPAALVSVREFLKANPDLEHWQRVLVFSISGTSLYFNTPEAKRAAIADSSLSILDEGLKEIEAAKNLDPDIRSRDIKENLEHRMQILIAEKRTADAAKVLDQCWPMMLSSTDLYSTMQWCRHWCAVRNQQNQPKQATEGLIKLHEQLLTRRDQFPWDVSLVLSDELSRQGKDDEALSWAKATFMLCSFDQWAIGQANPAVTRCLTASELSLVKGNAFAKAQVDPSAPNPLDGVPLPKFRTEAIKTQLDTQADLPARTRISRLLALGDYRGAMLLAKSQLVADVGNEDNAREVARVFKAKDGDIARANGFLTYYQQGQGENPIPAFLKETAGTTATTP